MQLHAEPEVWFGLEGCGEAHGHVDGDSGAAVEQARECGAGYAEMPGDFSDGVVGDVVSEYAAWVRRVGHGWSLLVDLGLEWFPQGLKPPFVL